MKVMVLLSRVPYPLEKGDKLRAFHQLKRLAEKHTILLCCLNDRPLHPQAMAELAPYCEDILVIRLPKWQVWFNALRGLFSNKPLQVNYFYSQKAQQQIDRFIEKHLPKHIFCQLVRVTEYVRKYSIIPKTLDYMDALSKGAARRVDKSPGYLRWVVQLEAKRLAQYEREIFKDFQGHSIISEQDRQLIDHPDADRIKVIPNGVDFEFFQPVEREQDYDLVFTGNMSYPPNIESARFIVTEILPLLKKDRPNIRVLLSGANPVAAVRSLQSSNVTVSGWVKDIRDSYARGKIFLAPMQIGTGLQNKLLEAMAMGLPCITSDLANNALGATPGKNILIGQTAADYARLVNQLLEQESQCQQLASEGATFVRSVYNWDETTESLRQLILREHPALSRVS